MNNHQLWLDTLNMAQQQGKPLSQALTRADEALTIADNWPFKYVNGVQTPQSASLELDKKAHKPTQFDLSTTEDALL